MVEDRSFEGIQPRPRQHIPRDTGQLQDNLHFHGKRLRGGITPARSRRGKAPRDFLDHPARLSIRAPRNFYYRARGAREGPSIYSESGISEVSLVA